MGDVSIGADNPSINPNVLMEIFGSSETVQARIKQFEEAKAQAEASYEKLRIGTDAKAAYDDATAKKNEADAVLLKAKASADDALNTLSEASSRASTILQEANAKVQASAQAVADERAKHDAWLASSKLDMDTRRADLEKTLSEAQKSKADYEVAAAASRDATNAANRAIATANAAETDFKEKAAQLKSALENITNQREGK